MSNEDRFQERLQAIEFEDTLEPVGIAVGAFVALVGLGTLAGTPWSYTNSLAIAAGQIVGALATVAIGIGLVWLSRA